MICVSLNEPDFDKCTALLKKYDFAELRADLCALTPQQTAHAVSINSNIIVTYRFKAKYNSPGTIEANDIITSFQNKDSREEYNAISNAGNNGSHDKENSLSFKCLMAAIDAGAAYIDIELEYPRNLFMKLREAAIKKGCCLIISYHDYSGTPALKQLTAKMEECIKMGADIVKIVTAAEEIAQASKILQLYSIFNKKRQANSKVKRNAVEGITEKKSNKRKNREKRGIGKNTPALIAFAMNEAGRFTRPLSIRLGAPFCYAKPNEGKATATGQYTLDEMLSLAGNYNIILPSLHDNFRKAQESFHLKTPKTNSQKNLQKAATKEMSPDFQTEIVEIDTKREIVIPCSKSEAQRCILAAIIAKGETVIHNYTACKDSSAALSVAKRLECEVIHHNGTLSIKSAGAEKIKENLRIKRKNIQLSAGESGLLARLLMPFVCYLVSGTKLSITVTGKGTLLNRNIVDSAIAIEESGCKCLTTNTYNTKESVDGYHNTAINEISYKGSNSIQNGTRRLPCTISGYITNNRIRIDGKGGSQIVSGYLMTLPLLSNKISLILSNPTSIPYIKMTINVLNKFGITIQKKREEQTINYRITPENAYTPASITLTADWSSATAFLVAEAIRLSHYDNAKSILLKGVHTGTDQADETIVEVLEMCGATLHEIESGIYLTIRQKLSPFNFDSTNSPDLFPMLALLACFCNGKSSIKGVCRLKEKESNRAESILSELTILGANISIVSDFMYICGGKAQSWQKNKIMRGGEVQSHHDHRIAICLTIAALFIGDRVKIDETKCIDKSFPAFKIRVANYLNLIKQY